MRKYVTLLFMIVVLMSSACQLQQQRKESSAALPISGTGQQQPSGQPSSPVLSGSSVSVEEQRAHVIANNQKELQKSNTTITATTTPMSVVQFFITHGVNVDGSPKEVLPAGLITAVDRETQFSVLLSGNQWPACFLFNIFREETNVGTMWHCHVPSEEEKKSNSVYIASKPIALEKLRKGVSYRVELLADERKMGSFTFQLSGSSKDSGVSAKAKPSVVESTKP